MKKFKIWQYIAGLCTLLSILGGLFLVDDRWNQSNIVQAAEENTIKTFKMFQMKQEMDIKKIQIEIYNIRYDSATNEYYRLKKELRDNPNDEELKEDIQRIHNARMLIDKKRMELMN